jgi:hypothetical protein
LQMDGQDLWHGIHAALHACSMAIAPRVSGAEF